MIAKSSYLFICSLLIFTESAFVDDLPNKCSIKDWDCQRELFQTVLKSITKTGIPEYNIPPTDPYEIKNVTVKVLDQIEITLVDGVAKGVRNCVVNKFETEVEKEHATMELTCDLTVKGKYKAHADSPLLANILGGSTVHAEGNAKVVIKKMHMVFDFRFYIRQHEDGELYVDCQRDDVKYSYDLGKVTFAANGIRVGDSDASALVVGLLNGQWKTIMQSFGKPFLDRAMEIIYNHAHQFFGYTPTKYYLTDDLTPYIKKD